MARAGVFQEFRQFKSIQALEHDFAFDDRSKLTLGLYLRHIRIFLRRLNLDPDQFVAACRSGKVDPTEEMKQFIAWLLEREVKGEIANRSSMNSAICAVKKFLEVNSVKLGEFRKPRIAKSSWVAKDRALTLEELRRVLEHADLRDRLLVTLLACSGIRVGATTYLKYRHVKEDLEAGKVPCKLVVYGDTEDRYVTFLTQECVELLREYLEDRRRRGETIGDESPLIRNVLGLNRKSREKPVKPITGIGAKEIVDKLFTKAGLRPQTDESLLIRERRLPPEERSRRVMERRRKRYEVHCHSLRKWFRTQLELAGVKKMIAEMMMGHDIELDSNYLRPSIEEMRSEYAKAEHLLSIMPRMDERQRKLETLRTMAGALGIEVEIKDLSIEKEIEVLEQRIKQATQILAQQFARLAPEQQKQIVQQALSETKNSNNQLYESWIVSGEEELIKYLNEGWDLVKELSNGKIVVRRKNQVNAQPPRPPSQAH